MRQFTLITTFVILSATLVACESEPPPKPAPPPPTCAEKFADAAAWLATDLTALPEAACEERDNGLFACNKRGDVYDCFDCNAVKKTYPKSGAAGLEGLGVDDDELVILQGNYDNGCVAQVEWDVYAPDAITRNLICPQGMSGMRVCRNIDGNIQWWTLGGVSFRRQVTQATLGNSKGTKHTLRYGAAAANVLDDTSYRYLGCEDFSANLNPGWDISVESQGQERVLTVDLIEAGSAAAEPDAADFERLDKLWTGCDGNYSAWE